eukprot:6189147-Pleurochrysis_carterae.AAC.1
MSEVAVQQTWSVACWGGDDKQKQNAAKQPSRVKRRRRRQAGPGQPHTQVTVALPQQSSCLWPYPKLSNRSSQFFLSGTIQDAPGPILICPWLHLELFFACKDPKVTFVAARASCVTEDEDSSFHMAVYDSVVNKREPTSRLLRAVVLALLARTRRLRGRASGAGAGAKWARQTRRRKLALPRPDSELPERMNHILGVLYACMHPKKRSPAKLCGPGRCASYVIHALGL